MIPRYSLPEMEALFTDVARMAGWLEVELAAVDGWASVGVISAPVAEAIRARALDVTSEFVAQVNAREAVTDHDLAAFVDVLQDAIGAPEGSWVHYGLTSSDVVDTALCSTLVSASDLLIVAASALIDVLKTRVKEHIDTPMAGRTHGQHAEPTTFGVKLALWCLQVDRDRTRPLRGRDAIAVGKLSGAVGTYSNIDPAVEDYVCNVVGLRPVPATQVISSRPSRGVPLCVRAPSAPLSRPSPLRYATRLHRGGGGGREICVGQRGARQCPTNETRCCRRGCRALQGYCAATCNRD